MDTNTSKFVTNEIVLNPIEIGVTEFLDIFYYTSGGYFAVNPLNANNESVAFRSQTYTTNSSNNLPFSILEQIYKALAKQQNINVNNLSPRVRMLAIRESFMVQSLATSKGTYMGLAWDEVMHGILSTGVYIRSIQPAAVASVPLKIHYNYISQSLGVHLDMTFIYYVAIPGICLANSPPAQPDVKSPYCGCDRDECDYIFSQDCSDNYVCGSCKNILPPVSSNAQSTIQNAAINYTVQANKSENERYYGNQHSFGKFSGSTRDADEIFKTTFSNATSCNANVILENLKDILNTGGIDLEKQNHNLDTKGATKQINLSTGLRQHVDDPNDPAINNYVNPGTCNDNVDNVDNLDNLDINNPEIMGQNTMDPMLDMEINYDEELLKLNQELGNNWNEQWDIDFPDDMTDLDTLFKPM